MSTLIQSRNRGALLLALLFAISIAKLSFALEPPIYNSQHTSHPKTGLNGMVSSRESIASEAALEILKNGGNAIDAAVTLGFVLAVTNPQAGNIGGGGFMLVHLAERNETIAIDYREKAPLAAKRDMFLDANGDVDKELSRYSHLSAGVPGTVAGLCKALDEFGSITLAEAMAPAIDLAKNGFVVGEDLYQSLIIGKERLAKAAPHALPIFYGKDGYPLRPGEILKLPELANTLSLIAKKGPSAFYEGKIADLIVEEMEANGGIITKEDLMVYEPSIRKPVSGNYKGYEIVSMPPPSSGGAHIIQILNILEPFDLKSMGHNSAESIHLMAEAMKYAYADRSKHLGDSDFSPVPLEWITSKRYGAEISEKLNLKKATPSVEIHPGEPNHEGLDTTHFSAMDKYGNAVSNTYTINFSFGSKVMPSGTGFFLNNEMDDFSSKPGTPNAYGLIGGEYNAIEAEKRMLSSMSPTIVLKDGVPFLLTGSRGGSQIITMTLQVVLNVIEHEMNLSSAVSAPRIHHQWLPDVLVVEKGVSIDTQRILEGKGYEVRQGGAMGTTNSILFEQGVFYGAADPRRPDSHAAGY